MPDAAVENAGVQPLGPSAANLAAKGLTCVRYVINARTKALGSRNSYDSNTILNSSHPGGIDALFTDGTVRFITDGIDFTNFQKLVVRNDGLTTESP